MAKTKSNIEVNPALASKGWVNKIPLFDSTGKKKETLELDKDIFNGRFNEAVLYQAVKMYRANKRRGNASTKTRADVEGAGRKPWKQKGTGRARAGSIRSPLWRHGGISFGPHPRRFQYTLPRKVKRIAFISSVNAKLKSAQVLAIEELSLDGPKTKKIYDLLEKLKINKRVLFLVDKMDKNLILASRNIRNLTLKRVDEATALDVLSHDNLLVAKKALEALGKRGKE